MFGEKVMRNRVAWAAVALVFISAAFISGNKDFTDSGFRILEENGIPVAMNPDHPVPLPDSPKDIAFTEEYSIGATEGDPNNIFGEFIRFAVDDEGNVYVLDVRGKTVRKFDRRGEFLFSFGSAGQGPGEFSAPLEIRYLPDGHIMVFEGESQKYSCFTKEGDVVNTIRFKKLMFPPYFSLTGGHIIATNVQRNPEQTVYVVGLFDDQSELVETLNRIGGKPDQPWPAGSDPDARARRFAETFSKVAFSGEAVLALDEEENIYFGFTDKYEIKIMDKNGGLRKIIRAELPFLPVEKKDRQAFLEYRLPRDISTWGTMDEALKNKIKSLIQFRDKKPAFLSLIPMDDRYLMVVRDGNYGQNALIDIFDPSGGLVIEKKMPFAIKGGICKGHRFYTIYEDEDGNQFIRCYSYRLF
jgi:hypothetical protein